MALLARYRCLKANKVVTSFLFKMRNCRRKLAVGRRANRKEVKQKSLGRLVAAQVSARMAYRRGGATTRTLWDLRTWRLCLSKTERFLAQLSQKGLSARQTFVLPFNWEAHCAGTRSSQSKSTSLRLQGVQMLFKSATSGDTAELGELLSNAGIARHVSCQDEEEWTPLHHAVDGNHLEAARLLLEHKADVNAVTSNGDSALLLAIRWSFSELALLLLAQPGIDVTLSVSSPSSNTALR